MNDSHSVTEDYEKRRKLWVDSSVWLGTQEAPYASLSIQALGYAERMLLRMETQLGEMVRTDAPRKPREWLLMECSAHSVLWVFGLYEILRVIKESSNPKFELLQELFRKLEVLRMPLAKHEVKSLSRRDDVFSHYPTGTWEPETGRVGWSVFGPKSGAAVVLTRTALANEFLVIAAVPPDFPRPFPIGGPLDED